MDNFRSVILAAAKDADLNLRERVKLRVVLRWRREQLEQELFSQAQVEGVIPVGAGIDDELGAVDWEALAEFIKAILPAVLQIIQLFL